MNSSRSMASPSSNGFETAAATASMHASGAGRVARLRQAPRVARRRWTRFAASAHLSRSSRTLVPDASSATTLRANAIAASSGRRRRRIEQGRASTAPPRLRVAPVTIMSIAVSMSDEARQPLRAAGAGQQSELHFGQRDRRVGASRRGNGIPARARGRRPSRCRRSPRSPACRSPRRSAITVRSVGSASDFGVLNSRMSAPAENDLPAPVRTIASTARRRSRDRPRRRSRCARRARGRSPAGCRA